MRGSVVSGTGAVGCALRCPENRMVQTFQGYVILDAKREQTGSLKVKGDLCLSRKLQAWDATAHRDLLLFGNFRVQTLLCAYFRSLSLWGPPATPASPELDRFSKWPPSSSTFPPFVHKSIRRMHGECGLPGLGRLIPRNS